MKKIQLLSLNTILLVSLLLGTQVQAEVSHVSVAVDGLGCPFCVYGLEKHLKQVDGVKNVAVQLVWEPPWDKEMMSEAALVKLDMF